MKAGFVKTYQTPKGVFFEPESISFASMDQPTFEDVYSRVLDIILKDIGATKEDVETMLNGFL